MNSIDVSVIVPVYNSEKYLNDCIQSIVKQTLPNIEIILVDDGSTDESGRICDEYAKNDSRIQVYHIPNGGAAKARNIGLLNASGEYVGFVDSDDWVEPNMYSVLYNSAKNQDADIVWCNVLKNESEKQKKYIPSKIYNKMGIESVIYPLLIANVDETNCKSVIRGSVCIRIFRKSMIDQFNITFPEEFVYNEDGMFCIQSTLNASRYVYLGNEYLYHNRCVSDSITKRYIENLWSRQRGIKKYLEQITVQESYPFQTQIDKKMFDVAIYCIENECRNQNTKLADKQIKRICSDSLTLEAIKKTSLKKLCRIKQLYYWGIKTKSVFFIRMAFNRRYKSK